MFVNYFKNLALNYKNAAYAIPGDHSTSQKCAGEFEFQGLPAASQQP